MDDLRLDEMHISGSLDKDDKLEIVIPGESIDLYSYLNRAESIKFIEHIAAVHEINIRELAI